MISRLEAIDILIKEGKPVNEANISEKINLEIKDSPISAISKGFSIDNSYLLEVEKYFTYALGDSAVAGKELEATLSEKTIGISNRLFSIRNKIKDTLDLLKEAKVTDSSMAGIVETIVIDAEDSSVVDQTKTTAVIKNGMVLAVPESKADASLISLRPYTSENINTYMTSDFKEGGLVAEFVMNGLSRLPDKDEAIINGSNKFRLSAESLRGGHKDLVVVLDKNDQEVFSQIEISLERPHLLALYVSNDGKQYEEVYSGFKFVKENVIPVSKGAWRYVKFIFKKSEHDSRHNGKYRYTVLVNQLRVLKSTIETSSVFQTNNLNLSGTYSKVAIDSCDSESFSEGTKVTYFVSVNDGPWTELRAARKMDSGKIIRRSVMNLEDFIHNKMMVLEGKSDDNLYDLEIPIEFMLSNSVRVFGEAIPDTTNDWEFDGVNHSCIALLYERKELNFNDAEVLINGKWATGQVTLEKGVYKIETSSRFYIHLFNPKQAEVLPTGTGEYTVRDKGGNVRTVLDPIYPNNVKLIVEEGFDLIFKQELIENRDFSIYNGGGNIQISTKEDHGRIYIAYRLLESNATAIKVKAELSSLDKQTIPYIDRLSIRLI